MAQYFIHLPVHKISPDNPSSKGFYGLLYRELTARGGEVQFLRRQSVLTVPDGGDGFHFVHQGLVRAPNALNTGLSYLKPFWYADPKGVFGESSIAEAVFDASAIPQNWANGFHRRLVKWHVTPRVSKHTQPQAGQSFGAGHVAVFLQGTSLPVLRAQHMDELAMLRAILRHIPDRPVLVKPHPRNAAPELLEAAAVLARQNPRLQIVEANVHDLLEGAHLCCSVSSSVAVEAMIHEVPVLAFGRTDYHHCAATSASPGGTAAAYRQAVTSQWPFRAFLYWFFRGQCLDPRDPEWFAVLSARMGRWAPDPAPVN